MFFTPFSIAIILLGEERASLCAFRAFVCFARDGLCLFPLPLGVRDWLRLATVALPGLLVLSFCHFTQIVSLDTFHEMSKGKNIIEFIYLPSAELAQRVVKVNICSKTHLRK